MTGGVSGGGLLGGTSAPTGTGGTSAADAGGGVTGGDLGGGSSWLGPNGGTSVLGTLGSGSCLTKPDADGLYAPIDHTHPGLDYAQLLISTTAPPAPVAPSDAFWLNPEEAA